MAKTLRPYQVEDLDVLASHESGLLASGLGSGKTLVAVELVRRLNLKRVPRVLVVAPIGTLGQWAETFAEQYPSLSRNGLLRITGTHKKDVENWAAMTAKQPGVYLIGWEAMRGVVDTETKAAHSRAATKEPKLTVAAIRQAMKDGTIPPWSRAGKFDLVIADECVRHDTKISTPSGPRNISALKPGDLVLGVDHASGEAVWTEVKGVSRSRLRETVRVGGLDLTANHPVWTDRDKGTLRDEWYERSDCGDRGLRTLRECVYVPQEGEEASILQDGMRQVGIGYDGNLRPLRDRLSDGSGEGEVLLAGMRRGGEEGGSLRHHGLQDVRQEVHHSEVSGSNLLFEELRDQGPGSLGEASALPASGQEDRTEGGTPAADVRVVRGGVRDTPVHAAKVLRKGLFDEVDRSEPDGGPQASTGSTLGIHALRGVACEVSGVDGADQVAPGCPGETEGAFGLGSESDPGSVGSTAICGGEQAERVDATGWREWAGVYRSAGEVAQGAGSGVGRGVPYQDADAARVGVPVVVQGGPGASGGEGCNRGARPWAREGWRSREREGQEEEGVSGVHWLDGPLDLERGDPSGSLWNIETGSGNYFANGLLVHNCHRISNKNASQAKVLKLIQADRRLALSATFSGNKEEGAWSTLNWLWKDRYPAFWAWADKFLCIDEKKVSRDKTITTVGGEKNPGAIWDDIPCAIRRRTEELGIHLPEVIERIVRIPMGPVQEQQYRSFEEDAFAWLDDNPVGTPLPITQRIRLRQAALGQLMVSETTVRTRSWILPEAVEGFLAAFEENEPQVHPSRKKVLRAIEMNVGDLSPDGEVERPLVPWKASAGGVGQVLNSQPLAGVGTRAALLPGWGGAAKGDPALRTMTRVSRLLDVEEIDYAERGDQPKLTVVKEILRDLPPDEPVIIFTHSAKWARMAAAEIDAAGIYGEARAWTGDLTKEQREGLKGVFGVMGPAKPQSGFGRRGVRILICQIQAIAEGVDGLQHRCRCEIWASPSEDGLINEQAKGRLHRPGQKSPVQRWVLRSEESIDEDVAETLEVRRVRMGTFYRDAVAA